MEEATATRIRHGRGDAVGGSSSYALSVTRTSVHDLPNELLSRIFLECAQQCRESYEGASWEDYDQQPYKWLVVSHVCKHWRAVALAYPSLWDWIVPMRASATRAFVERAAEQSLSIVNRRIPSYNRMRLGTRWDENMYPHLRALCDLAGDDASTDDEEAHIAIRCIKALQIALRRLHRIERLDMWAGYPLPIDTSQGAPLLRSLTLRSEEGAEKHPVLELFRGLTLTSLTSFHCWAQTLVIRDFISENIASMSLSGREQGILGPDNDRAALLHTLTLAPRLRRLRIDHVDSLFGFGQALAIPSSERTVDLPSLRYLHVADYSGSHHAILFLQYLHFPRGKTSVTVSDHSGSPRDRARDPTYTQAIADVFPSPSSPIVVSIRVYDYRSVSLSMWNAATQTGGYKSRVDWDDSDPLFTLNFEWPVPHGHRHNGTDAELIQTVCSWLPLERVHTLFLDYPLTSNWWRSAFAGMVNLHQLYVEGRASFNIPDVLLPFDDCATAPEVQMLFPRLAELVLDGNHWTLPRKRPGDRRPNLARRLASSLSKRDSVTEVFIRRGKGITKADAELLATDHRRVDWEGS